MVSPDRAIMAANGSAAMQTLVGNVLKTTGSAVPFTFMRRPTPSVGAKLNLQIHNRTSLHFHA